MKKSILYLLLASSLAYSPVSFSQPKPPILNSLFSKQNAIMQDRLCGEILFSLSLAGLKREDKNQQDLAKEILVESALYFKMTLGMPLEEKKNAKKISEQIEKIKAVEHVSIASACTNRLKYLASTGEITEESYNEAQKFSLQMLANVKK